MKPDFEKWIKKRNYEYHSWMPNVEDINQFATDFAEKEKINLLQTFFKYSKEDCEKIINAVNQKFKEDGS